MKTVGDLKSWLTDKGDDLPVQILIETEGCQYQYPMNDVALVVRNGVEQRYIVIMHEMFDRKVK
jgi:hypothetical protein